MSPSATVPLPPPPPLLPLVHLRVHKSLTPLDSSVVPLHTGWQREPRQPSCCLLALLYFLCAARLRSNSPTRAKVARQNHSFRHSPASERDTALPIATLLGFETATLKRLFLFEGKGARRAQHAQTLRPFERYPVLGRSSSPDLDRTRRYLPTPMTPLPPSLCYRPL
jgi:hypothetical protein